MNESQEHEGSINQRQKPEGRVELQFEMILNMQGEVQSVGHWKYEVQGRGQIWECELVITPTEILIKIGELCGAAEKLIKRQKEEGVGSEARRQTDMQGDTER